MTNKDILNIAKGNEENFNSLLDAVNTTLTSAIDTFSNYFQLNEKENLLKYMKYDYNSLQVTIMYELLNLLSITYSENLSKNRVKQELSYDITFDHHGSLLGMNSQRVERIQTLYQKRNESHMYYLNAAGYSPKIIATDTLWYELVSDFPVLKRFLANKEPIITKKFFDDLNEIYGKMNSYSGYDRFHLMYKLEMSSKLEMYYKILTAIKKEKRSRKLNADEINKYIVGMYALHVIPYNPPELQIIVNGNDPIGVFTEIMGIPMDEKTINGIIFNVDKLLDYYIEVPSSVQNFICFLNVICKAVVFHLCNKIEQQLSMPNDSLGFDFIKGLQHCESSTEYFENFINNNNYINYNKNCQNDITFLHFKKIYNIKSEPPRKKH